MEGEQAPDSNTEANAPDSDTEPITREVIKHINGHKVTISVEVERLPEGYDPDNTYSPQPSSEERLIEAAVAAVEGGVNTDYESWDEEHPVPTRNGRVI